MALVEKGDLVLVTYQGKSVNSGVSLPSNGKPVLVAAASGMLLPGLDEGLVGLTEGNAATVAVPKDKGFGDRDPKMVQLIPLRQFHDRGIDPAVGQVLDFDGAPGRVTSVSSGRVMVDFNPEMAGHDLEFQVTVNAVAKDAAARLSMINQEMLPSAQIKLEGSAVRVTVPAETAKVDEYANDKMRVLYFASRHVPGVKEVVFEEHYAVPKE